jgi:hypothetical protein
MVTLSPVRGNKNTYYYQGDWGTRVIKTSQHIWAPRRFKRSVTSLVCNKLLERIIWQGICSNFKLQFPQDYKFLPKNVDASPLIRGLEIVCLSEAFNDFFLKARGSILRKRYFHNEKLWSNRSSWALGGLKIRKASIYNRWLENWFQNLSSGNGCLTTKDFWIKDGLARFTYEKYRLKGW